MWIGLNVRDAVVLASRSATAVGTSEFAAQSLPANLYKSDPAWITPMTRALVWTWLGLNIAGQALLALLLVTFLFSRRLNSKRHPVVINFVLTWLLSTIPACLLLYGNGHLERQPDPSLCLYNAALVAGIPPMVACSFFAVVAEVYLMMRSVTAQKEYARRTWLTVTLIAAPYAAFIAFALITGVVGFNHPENVDRDAEMVFCSVSKHNLAYYIWIPTTVVVTATLGLGVALVILLWRNWRGVRGNSVVDINLVIRALCFAVFELFLIATFMLAIFDNNTVPKFMQAVAPVAVFFIFSTQPDVLHSWFFCFGRDNQARVMVRISTISPPRSIPGDEEKAVPDFAFQPKANSQPSAMRGVPGLRVSTIGMPAPQQALSTHTRTPSSSGVRPLVLAGSVAPSPVRAPASRPTHSASVSDLGNSIMLRPDSRPRLSTYHERSGSVASLAYSDMSYRTTNSTAPLVQTVNGRSTPQVYNDGSYRSNAGILDSAPYDPARRG
ncbi:hypothetical protein BKA62DRAFT_686265 [Auriculariales sp. MPI-PUGE-AT-0066]|nr:hypothetical protein BKA62DRAFT_686265 [Auriculariales sp. MPI-PUGE-AT-0066]